MIASAGAGTMGAFLRCVYDWEGGCGAGGLLFHFGEITIPALKTYLSEEEFLSGNNDGNGRNVMNGYDCSLGLAQAKGMAAFSIISFLQKKK